MQTIEHPNLLRNKDPTATLGPFDGVVAAVTEINGVQYFITSNTDYVPAVPSAGQHDVFLRKDMRYGLDDPTLWPQQFSERYCHFAAMRTRQGSPPEAAMFWWDPTPEDFICSKDSSTLTRALGKLDGPRLAALALLVRRLQGDCRRYAQSTPPDKIPPSLHPMFISMRLALGRLVNVPSTYSQMVLAVTSLQRICLEVDCMIEYMTVYKPRMGDPDAIACPPARVMGAYTHNPEIAQHFHAAGLPYWLIRSVDYFCDENILSIISPRLPSHIELEAHPDYSVICKTSQNTEVKVEAIHKVSQNFQWYSDPFEFAALGAPTSQSMSRPSPLGAANRYAPYSQRPAPPKGSGGRNKFQSLDRPEMPSYIPCWKRALAEVDLSRPSQQIHSSDCHYVLPEPALLASSETPSLRQKHLHHFVMLHDACLYRLGNPDVAGSQLLLSSQQWRDVLTGKVTPQGRPNTKSRGRSVALDQLLRPALEACGVDASAFPADPTNIPAISMNRAKEIIWEIAETNFRYEFVALDRRASGSDRFEECTRCFVGEMMMGMPLELSKQGFAAEALGERHQYTFRVARLMTGWRVLAPQVIRDAGTVTVWTTDAMQNLERAVTKHYVQTFYELFGRAAVIHMRLEHELGK